MKKIKGKNVTKIFRILLSQVTHSITFFFNFVVFLFHYCVVYVDKFEVNRKTLLLGHYLGISWGQDNAFK